MRRDHVVACLNVGCQAGFASFFISSLTAESTKGFDSFVYGMLVAGLIACTSLPGRLVPDARSTMDSATAVTIVLSLGLGIPVLLALLVPGAVISTVLDLRWTVAGFIWAGGMLLLLRLVIVRMRTGPEDPSA